jgi:hypothetical protein
MDWRQYTYTIDGGGDDSGLAEEVVEDSLTDARIAALNAEEDAAYKNPLPADTFTPALVRAKTSIYKYFMEKTAPQFEQDVDLMIDHYPTFLAKWAAEICKGPTNLPPRDIPAPDYVKKALTDLAAEMRACAAADPVFGLQTCCYWVKALFITYPYAMNIGAF